MAPRTMSPESIALTLPPLPPLSWDGYGWRGAMPLPAWRGFTAGRVGGRGAPRVRLEVCHPDTDDELPRRVPTPAQVAAYRDLEAHGQAVAALAWSALLPYAQRELVDFIRDALEAGGAAPPRAPAVVTDLRRLVRPVAVHLLDVEHGGVGYLGLQLSCVWDSEHGAGVLLHRRRIVAVGQASAAFHEGDAAADAARQAAGKGRAQRGAKTGRRARG